MSLATYSDLVSAVSAWLFDRTDLAARTPDFIALAEAQINRRLTTQEMTTVVSGNISGETMALPDDFAGVKSFRLSTSPISHLEYRTADDLDDVLGDGAYATGQPRFYTIEGGNFVFSPVPVDTYAYRLRYRTRLTPLSESAPTNWLLTKHPDVYLYGALVQSAPYLAEDERLSTWGSLFTQALADVAADEQTVAFGPAPAMRARPIR